MGTTPSITRAIRGSFDSAATIANPPVSSAGTKSRKLSRRNRTSPSTLRVIRLCSAPTGSCDTSASSTFIRWATTRTYMSRSMRVHDFSTR